MILVGGGLDDGTENAPLGEALAAHRAQLGLVLGFRPEGGAVGVVLSVVLVFSFCLSWLWTMLSLILRTPKMPGWMQAVVEVNPITHLATVVRGLMHGSVPAGKSAGCSSRPYFSSPSSVPSPWSSPATRSRCRYREHLVEINSDNPAHSANAITGTKPGTPETGPKCK